MSLITNLLRGGDPFVTMMNMCPVLSTPIDWKETPEAHIFIADLPGLSKDDVKVEVDDNRVLQISGKWKEEEEAEADDDKKKDKKETWRRVERNRGSFCRRFRLPGNTKVDQVEASMENGVLNVIVPKEEIKKPITKVIEIEEK